MLIEIAFKNVFRNRKRTMLTLIAVFWGVLLTIVANGLNKGLEWQIGNLYIKTDTSSLKIVNRDYQVDTLENPLDYPVKEYEKLLPSLSNDSQVQAFSPRITFHGSLTNGLDEIRAIGMGIDPQYEDAVFQRTQNIVAGSYLKPGEDGAVIGVELARLLDLKIGDTVTVIAQATEMGMNAYDLEIKGFISTGNPVIDNGYFFVPISFARDFLSFTGVTDIAVALKNNSKINVFQKTFNRTNWSKNTGEKIKLLTYEDFMQDFKQLVDFRGQIIKILTSVILLMAAAGIINTMLMAMMERKREIGNLMAMGVRRTEIWSLFLIEGAMIGLLGSTAATILGSSIVYYFQVNGIPLGSTIMNTFGNVPIAGKFYAYFDPKAVGWYFLTGLLVATISAVYPAIKSAQLQPVEAIRENRG